MNSKQSRILQLSLWWFSESWTACKRRWWIWAGVVESVGEHSETTRHLEELLKVVTKLSKGLFFPAKPFILPTPLIWNATYSRFHLLTTAFAMRDVSRFSLLVAWLIIIRHLQFSCQLKIIPTIDRWEQTSRTEIPFEKIQYRIVNLCQDTIVTFEWQKEWSSSCCCGLQARSMLLHHYWCHGLPHWALTNMLILTGPVSRQQAV